MLPPTPRRAGSCPPGPPARDPEKACPYPPERSQRPVPEDFEQAPAAEQKEVAGSVAAEADLLDRDPAGGLQLPEQERASEEGDRELVRDEVEHEHHDQEGVPEHLQQRRQDFEGEDVRQRHLAHRPIPAAPERPVQAQIVEQPDMPAHALPAQRRGPTAPPSMRWRRARRRSASPADQCVAVRACA